MNSVATLVQTRGFTATHILLRQSPEHFSEVLPEVPVLAIRATWDDDAKVRVAESDDAPGLATEAASLDELVAKLRDLIPALLELNESKLPREITFELLAR